MGIPDIHCGRLAADYLIGAGFGGMNLQKMAMCRKLTESCEIPCDIGGLCSSFSICFIIILYVTVWAFGKLTSANHQYCRMSATDNIC